MVLQGSGILLEGSGKLPGSANAFAAAEGSRLLTNRIGRGPRAECRDMGDVKSDDYYKVLGVSKSATEAEIAKGALACPPCLVAEIHHQAGVRG
jgi:hypothetical protein